VNQVIQQLRRWTLLPDAAGQSDAQLLERFQNKGDALAFEALLGRHGPMVLGVCRRVLRDHHEAEDAFQATFLVFVRKARDVSPAGALANWLYGVAYRTALKAKARAAMRRSHEQRAANNRTPREMPAAAESELPAALDDALSRLADKYRIPFILCELEGHSQRDAARQLGWPEGTLFVRLMRAKKLLAKRLARRGFGPAAALTAVALTHTASASVPAALMARTVNAVVAGAHSAMATGAISVEVADLVKGVVRSMLFTRFKIAFVILLAVGVGFGARPFVGAFFADEQSDKNAIVQPKDAKAADAGRPAEALADAKVRKIAVERVGALRKLTDARAYDYQVGKTTGDYFVTAHRLLIEADLALCQTAAQRQASLERALELARSIKELDERRFLAENIGPATYFMTYAHYLDVAGAYEREKGTPAPASPEPKAIPVREQAKKTSETYYPSLEALKVETNRRLQEYQSGKISIPNPFLNVYEQWVRAENAAIQSTDERMAHYEKALKYLESFKEWDERSFREGAVGAEAYLPFRRAHAGIRQSIETLKEQPGKK
jgi:RNA polymerase sigma factor (sigma-70 family)